MQSKPLACPRWPCSVPWEVLPFEINGNSARGQGPPRRTGEGPVPRICPSSVGRTLNFRTGNTGEDNGMCINSGSKAGTVLSSFLEMSWGDSIARWQASVLYTEYPRFNP